MLAGPPNLDCNPFACSRQQLQKAWPCSFTRSMCSCGERPSTLSLVATCHIQRHSNFIYQKRRIAESWNTDACQLAGVASRCKDSGAISPAALVHLAGAELSLGSVYKSCSLAKLAFLHSQVDWLGSS